MRISLNALEHLGMNLYSNVPAVLSEVVANSWDADAENVNVTLEKGAETITIEDDGVGMTRDDVIDCFLTVGFKRRTTLGEFTPIKKRKPMGRKGIGKLSSFSIARVIDVYTRFPTKASNPPRSASKTSGNSKGQWSAKRRENCM
jgi:HSP90 family molecular chaperone